MTATLQEAVVATVIVVVAFLLHVRASLAVAYERVEKIQADTADLTTVNIHHWQQHNPVTTEALVLFDPADAVRSVSRSVMIDYYLKSAADKVTIDILDPAGSSGSILRDAISGHSQACYDLRAGVGVAA